MRSHLQHSLFLMMFHRILTCSFALFIVINSARCWSGSTKGYASFALCIRTYSLRSLRILLFNLKGVGKSRVRQWYVLYTEVYVVLI